MSKSDKGRRAEWELRDILEKRGYYVIRSAASHRIDLLAVGTGGSVVAIEVKSTGSTALSLTHTYEKEQYAGHLELTRRGVSVLYAVRWAAGSWSIYPVPLKAMLLKPSNGSEIDAILPAL